jgi:tetratricopeptide (TPR) repeat protein
VVVLTNSDKGADDIGFHLLDPQVDLREVKKSLATFIKKEIEEKGPEVAWTNYKTIKETDPESYEINESEINNLGYWFLERGNQEAAITTLKMNVDAFPNSSNVYDSYGEALMKAGQTEAAIENYQRSLQLNPGNNNAVEMLAKMGVKPEFEEVVVDETVLASYVGTYQVQPGFDIVITREGKQLFGQATGQGKFELFPKSDTEFYLKVVDAQLEFLQEDGTVKSLILLQNGQKIPGKKMD